MVSYLGKVVLNVAATNSATGEGFWGRLAQAGLSFNHTLERFLFVGVLLALAIGYFGHSHLNHYSFLITPLFAYLTFMTSIGTRVSDFRELAHRPFPIFYALILLHIVMPIMAFGIGHVVFPGAGMEPYRIGLVLTMAVPIGVTTVIWTQMMDGDLPLALAIVVLDTLISPLIVPATVRAFFGTQIEYSFSSIVVGLVEMVVLPTLAGILVCELSHGKAQSYLRPVAGPTSKLGLYLVIAINSAKIAPLLSPQVPYARLLIIIFVLCALSYTVGYESSALLPGRNQAIRVTLTYNVGMRNLCAGTVIATGYFPPLVGLTVILGMLYQQPLASLIAMIFRRGQGKGLRETADTGGYESRGVDGSGAANPAGAARAAGSAPAPSAQRSC